VWYQNIGSALFGFVTERRTGGRTELRLQRQR